MTNKYILSSGRSTTDISEYILDLFKLYLSINPGDIPGAPEMGFNFTFAGIPKIELPDKMSFRIGALVKKISDSFPKNSVRVEELQMTSEDTVKLTISVDGRAENSIFINIYDENS